MVLGGRGVDLGSAGNTYSLDRSDGLVLEEMMFEEVGCIVGEERGRSLVSYLSSPFTCTSTEYFA